MHLLQKVVCKRCRHSFIQFFHLSPFHICTIKSLTLFSPFLCPSANSLRLFSEVLLSEAISVHTDTQWPLDFPDRSMNSTKGLCLFSVHQGITNERKRKLEQQLQSIMVLNRQFEHVQNFINWAVCSKTSVPFLFSKELVRGSWSFS